MVLLFSNMDSCIAMYVQYVTSDILYYFVVLDSAMSNNHIASYLSGYINF